MAINKNHEFEDLDSIKCAIVEKNASAERVAFLKQLLEFNKYHVVIVGSPAPKTAPAAPVAAAASTNIEGVTSSTPPTSETIPTVPEIPVAPSTYTVGVTDLTFNAINAVFGRQLKTIDGHIVTLSYWQQKDTVSNDQVPYFEHVK